MSSLDEIVFFQSEGQACLPPKRTVSGSSSLELSSNITRVCAGVVFALFASWDFGNSNIRVLHPMDMSSSYLFLA